MSRRRKRLSPPDEYCEFYDAAHKQGYRVYVFRHVHDDAVHLQVMMFRGTQEEHTAPMVADVAGLAESVHGLRKQLERA